MMSLEKLMVTLLHVCLAIISKLPLLIACCILFDLRENTLVALYLHARWIGPCKMVKLKPCGRFNFDLTGPIMREENQFTEGKIRDKTKHTTCT
jgi:hypothetical protein